MKKNLIAILCVSSLLYSAPSDETDNSLETFPLDKGDSQEITAFDPNAVIQHPFSLQEIEPLAPLIRPPHKSAFLTVALSSLTPGLGHIYLGDSATAAGLIGSSWASLGVAAYPHSGESLRLASLLTLQTTWEYGIYAAYRDVRKYNGTAGYSYPMPTDSLTDLTLAPFSPSVLKKPEVWAGFLGCFSLAVCTAHFAYSKEAHIQLNASSRIPKPIFAFPIAIGEESFFRGYLQSQLTEVFTPVGGIVLSSLAFGAAHIPNALALEPEDRWRYYSFSLPLITGMGAYFGWMTYKNRSLKESVALHAWYDFTIFAASAVASQAAATGRPGFAIAIPF
jgi:membrane protease YdiL (CAAX protease family)